MKFSQNNQTSSLKLAKAIRFLSDFDILEVFELSFYGKTHSIDDASNLIATKFKSNRLIYFDCLDLFQNVFRFFACIWRKFGGPVIVCIYCSFYVVTKCLNDIVYTYEKQLITFNFSSPHLSINSFNFFLISPLVDDKL